MGLDSSDDVGGGGTHEKHSVQCMITGKHHRKAAHTCKLAFNLTLSIIPNSNTNHQPSLPFTQTKSPHSTSAAPTPSPQILKQPRCLHLRAPTDAAYSVQRRRHGFFKTRANFPTCVCVSRSEVTEQKTSLVRNNTHIVKTTKPVPIVHVARRLDSAFPSPRPTSLSFSLSLSRERFGIKFLCCG